MSDSPTKEERLSRGISRLVSLPEWTDIKTEVLPTLPKRERATVLAAMKHLERHGLRPASKRHDCPHCVCVLNEVIGRERADVNAIISGAVQDD